jgi:hypothetical protein
MQAAVPDADSFGQYLPHRQLHDWYYAGKGVSQSSSVILGSSTTVVKRGLAVEFLLVSLQ